MTHIRVFLSYAREDEKRVREIYKELEQKGFQPWFDREHILPGQAWKREIPRAMRRSHAVLMFLSKDSIEKRGYVQKEFKLALDTLEEFPEGKIYVIPVRLDDYPVPDEFSGLRWADLSEPDGLDKVLAALRVVGRQRAEDTDTTEQYSLIATQDQIRQTLQSVRQQGTPVSQESPSARRRTFLALRRTAVGNWVTILAATILAAGFAKLQAKYGIDYIGFGGSIGGLIGTVCAVTLAKFGVEFFEGPVVGCLMNLFLFLVIIAIAYLLDIPMSQFSPNQLALLGAFMGLIISVALMLLYTDKAKSK